MTIALFQGGDFTLASGAKSDYKVECDALNLVQENWETCAKIIARLAGPFDHAIGIPRGGIPLAEALAPYAKPGQGHPRLLVDDVWTTGGSMMKYYEDGDMMWVVFARGPLYCEAKAIWNMHGTF